MLSIHALHLYTGVVNELGKELPVVISFEEILEVYTCSSGSSTHSSTHPGNLSRGFFYLLFYYTAVSHTASISYLPSPIKTSIRLFVVYGNFTESLSKIAGVGVQNTS